MVFNPFLQSQSAQDIINNYLNGDYQAQPNLNSAGMWRNPQFDIRTQQELAGELDPSALYANPIMDWSATSTENETVDPCPPGFQLIDGVCQPNEQFGKSMYDEKKEKENEIEERPYMSIEDMKNASNEELIGYLKDGWLNNSKLGYLPSKGGEVTLGGKFMNPQFGLFFGKQNEMRRNAMISELTNRGYFTGNYNDKGDEVFNITSTPNPNVGFNEAEVPYGGAGIINQGVTGSYGGGEDFGSPYNNNNNNNNNIQNTQGVNYTNNEAQGTLQAGGGVPNPHTNTGFSGGNPLLTPKPKPKPIPSFLSQWG